MKQSGIELIAQERQEQIEKHNFTIHHDKYVNANKELVYAAEYCLYLAGFNTQHANWPNGWDNTYRQKIIAKSKINQLVTAGAFFMAENERRGDKHYQFMIDPIAAEIDRIQNKE